MSTVPVYTLAGERAGEFTLVDAVFGQPINAALIHQSVTATLNSRRQGTASTKTRGDVSHTTKKLYRQKGTGRARQGMRSAPHWKGGGVVFGPHPRSFAQSLPKKMRRAALLSALSQKANEDAIVVLDVLDLAAPRTRTVAAFLQAINLAEKKVLLVLNELDNAGALSFRNLPNVLIVTTQMLGTYDVLSANCLLFTRDSIERLQELKQQPLGAALWMAKQAQGGVA